MICVSPYLAPLIISTIVVVISVETVVCPTSSTMILMLAPEVNFFTFIVTFDTLGTQSWLLYLLKYMLSQTVFGK